MLISEYGYCPICCSATKARERRPDGDDICENGHKYPSNTAVNIIGKWVAVDGFSWYNYVEINQNGLTPDRNGRCIDIQINHIKKIRDGLWIPYKEPHLQKDELEVAAQSILEGLDDTIPGCTNWMVLGKNAKLLAQHYLNNKDYGAK